ncbi:RNA pseudouridine synthase [Candidatus Atribacteria bacterium RBG_19FT_COMBO_35_14]|uniref:Pseudouridine synthase n=1 Tax=Candidatus Sediminicultor quintus TaxID=1797291 RepID=A0A1F5A6R8_9BACT|nr:MAG: RNA pseudouridine synthase [Candidatus Atribacteria bacterium RBG_19FT_COMBO_35_14]
MIEKEKSLIFIGEEKIRIDLYLTQKEICPSRSQIRNLIAHGKIRVNSTPVKPSYILKNGDVIDLALPEQKELEIKAEAIPLDIIYEDDYLVVVNKPADMIVHPAGKICSGTLVNALLYHCRDSLSGIGGVIRPGIVHRLDKDTSGLIVSAKNDFAHLDLSRQIKDRQVTKKYLALVHGNMKDDSGIIDAPIGRSLKNRKKMAVTEGKSREAITQFQVLKRFSSYTLVEATLLTGRTHQLRVHLAFIGYPIVGDQLYGQRKQGLNISRQALHSHILGFVHPSSKKYMEFSAPLPQDMQELIDCLKGDKK